MFHRQDQALYPCILNFNLNTKKDSFSLALASEQLLKFLCLVMRC